MIPGDQPTIFPASLKVLVSSKADGTVKFGQDVPDEQVAENLTGLANRIGLGKTEVAGILITYDVGRTHDVIKELGNNVLDITNRSTWIACDALVTTQKRVGLLIPIADCNGVVVYDPDHEVLALAHIGWHAAAADLPRKLVDYMSWHHQSDPVKLQVYISPSIRKASYTQAEPAQLDLPAWQSYLSKSENGYQVDVFGFVKDQFIESGIKIANLEASPVDVAKSTDYPSHFRDKQANPKTARFAVICSMN